METIKPYFSDMGSNSKRIFLLENGSTLINDKNIAKTMNDSLINNTKNVKLKPYKDSPLILILILIR